jgi:hypothetical protein
MIDKKTYSIDPQFRTGNIPVQILHVLLERLMKKWIMDWKQGAAAPPRHPSFLLAYYKGFQVKNRLINHSPRGKALCLLKTQFAKKPKNPV